MIAQDFPERGWQFVQPGPALARVQVFGERCSGTNFVKRLIGRNTSLTPIESLGWKHGFPQMTAIPADVLIVGIVRDARTWALSMHAKPWHTPTSIQALDFDSFIQHEWASIADRPRYFEQVAELGGTGQPLQHDRHPLTGAPFANLFALRRAKLDGLLGFGLRGCSFALVRLEAIQAAPVTFVDALTTTFEIDKSNAEFRPVYKQLGAKFKPSIEDRPATPDAFPANAIGVLRATLDLPSEAALGYTY